MKSRRLGQGFTIVEIMIVIVVIAILAAITIVAYSSVQKQSQKSAAMAEMKSNDQKIAAYALANGTRMPTYAQTQSDSSITLTFNAQVYKRVSYCNGATQAAFGALLKTGDMVYMQIGGTPTVDNSYTTDTVCSKLGITNSDGSAATVSYVAGGWTFCANENGTCSFAGTTSVRYGANGTYNTINNVNGSIGCNNTVFGDPTPGIAKSCYYLN